MTPARTPSALIFDWDNTLVDSWHAIGEAINHVRAAFNEPLWTLEDVRKNCVYSAREIFPKWYGTEWEKACGLFYGRFDEVRRTKKLQVLAGAEELLRHLKDEKIPAMVVSNRQGPHLRHEVAALGWDKFFAVVVGATDAPRDKPARDPVDLALRKAGLDANTDVWFVGDSEIDVLCARNAGVTPIFMGDVSTGTRLSVAQIFSDCDALRTLLNERIRSYNHSNKTA